MYKDEAKQRKANRQAKQQRAKVQGYEPEIGVAVQGMTNQGMTTGGQRGINGAGSTGGFTLIAMIMVLTYLYKLLRVP